MRIFVCLFLTHSDPWKELKYVDFNCKTMLYALGEIVKAKRTQRKKTEAKHILSLIQWDIAHII